jgi:hypothetical protein
MCYVVIQKVQGAVFLDKVRGKRGIYYLLFVHYLFQFYFSCFLFFIFYFNIPNPTIVLLPIPNHTHTPLHTPTHTHTHTHLNTPLHTHQRDNTFDLLSVAETSHDPPTATDEFDEGKENILLYCYIVILLISLLF